MRKRRRENEHRDCEMCSKDTKIDVCIGDRN